MDACHAALGSVDRHIETGLRILLLSSLLPTPRLPHAHDRSYSSSTPVGAGTLTITATGLAPTPTQPPVTAPTQPPPVATPTRLPSQPPIAGGGQCGAPYPVTLGVNAFNNAPATGLTISTAGTSCSSSGGEEDITISRLLMPCLMVLALFRAPREDRLASDHRAAHDTTLHTQS